MQPAVLKLMGKCAMRRMRMANGQGCAARSPATRAPPATLIALGVDELSMSTPAIPLVKQAVREC